MCVVVVRDEGSLLLRLDGAAHFGGVDMNGLVFTQQVVQTTAVLQLQFGRG